MSKAKIFSILIVLLLISCSNGAISPLSARDTPIIEETYTSSTTHVFKPTSTVGPKVSISQSCLSVGQKEIPLHDVASGVALIFPNLLDIQSGKVYKLPAEQANPGLYGGTQVSPDRNMLAYLEDIQDSQKSISYQILWVVDAHAKVLARISFDRNDLGILNWLDNQRLIISTNTYDTLLLVNLVNNEQQTVTNELPLLDKFPFPGGPWWRVEYSSDLQWVAYAYRDDDASLGIIVRDVVSKKILWQSGDGVDSIPAWSPDGKEVAVIGDGQLYLVNRSGDANPILPDDVRQQAFSPSWSPDGQRIAFWNAGDLLVYNKQANRVVDLCIPTDGSLPPPPPLWSPDSQQIMVSYGVLIDIPQNKAYRIQEASNTMILGWMNSLP